MNEALWSKQRQLFNELAEITELVALLPSHCWALISIQGHGMCLSQRHHDSTITMLSLSLRAPSHEVCTVCPEHCILYKPINPVLAESRERSATICILQKSRASRTVHTSRLCLHNVFVFHTYLVYMDRRSSYRALWCSCIFTKT